MQRRVQATGARTKRRRVNDWTAGILACNAAASAVSTHDDLERQSALFRVKATLVQAGMPAVQSQADACGPLIVVAFLRRCDDEKVLRDPVGIDA